MWEEITVAENNDWIVPLRAVLTGSVEAARERLGDLNLASWHGRDAARRIAALLGRHPNSEDSRAFHNRVARWLADTWLRGRRSRDGDRRDYEAEHEMSRLIARFALTLPTPEARALCAPLVEVVDAEPREAAHFLHDLIVQADAGSEDCFWDLWQDFADRAGAAPWAGHLLRDRPYETELIYRLFLTAHWQEGVRDWHRLEGNADRVHSLAERLPPAVVCVDAYIQFLFTIGQGTLPDALVVVDQVIQRGDPGRIAAGSNVSFHLESLISRYVYAEPLRLKSTPRLRDAILRLLDLLVASGSSAAYRMRDDFVTPLPTR